jgi:hypothetical protein
MYVGEKLSLIIIMECENCVVGLITPPPAYSRWTVEEVHGLGIWDRVSAHS